MINRNLISVWVYLFCLTLGHLAWGQAVDNVMCLSCHGEEGFSTEIEGIEKSLYVDAAVYQDSIHGSFNCVDCHSDIDDVPHAETLKPVDCAGCHDEAYAVYAKSVHGEAVLEKSDRLAPTCASCHTSHAIQPAGNPASSTYIMNIPATCGRCHQEGTEVTTTHEIDQKNVISEYSMSIHGEGLFKRGLIVSAVCTSCHGSHDILQHQNPQSMINVNNVSKTCMQCHAQIEQVHQKIVEGRLWEQEPNKVPICVDCHAPHKIRRVFYNINIADGTCMACHSDPNIKMERDGQTISLYVDKAKHDNSVHGKTTCIQCHYDVHPDRDPVCKDSKPVDCGVCHAEEVNDHNQGIHGQSLAEGDPNAPSCQFCHGTHDILNKEDPQSPSFPRNVPQLCSRCHIDGAPVALRSSTNQHHIIANYTMSIHGKGLIESGLVVTAMCTNCHTSHKQLPSSDPQSSVNHQNIGETCGTCHLGIYETFRNSIHSSEVNDTEEELPACSDCHQSHTIMRVDKGDFRALMIDQCGRCHRELTETYFETYHGKVSKLGEVGAAKCYDCHGSHSIYPISDPRSSLHRDNIIGTCMKCHPGSHRKFTGYLTHATHHDKNRYPALYYSFVFMTSLLIGTLSFFGIHTLLWLVRSLIEHRKYKITAPAEQQTSQPMLYYRRFRILHRLLHVIVIVSFMSLATTGMILKFPDVPLFETLSAWLGGPHLCGLIHRTGALITFGYFGTHLVLIGLMLKRREITFKGLLSEGYSMFPTLQDARDLKQNFFWFLGRGEKPRLGRWTYWEKFDYFAVFWGVAIIGFTGLILWFPEIATHVFPGWMINVATVIHSDEALLAAGFIFTIHFFNTHFRPGVFPMDPVIFTGRVPLEEFKRERPQEYEELVNEGKLDRYIVGPPPLWLSCLAKIAGFTFLTIGIILTAAIVYGMFIAYK